jgi:2-methylcitrate dehydratase PrpD
MRDMDDALKANAALGNVLEMDDVHRSAILHPGPIVVPAALSVALQTDATLGDWLDATIRGYEATIRIGLTLDAHHYRYYHTTSTAGAFGAAAAAASLLQLDTDRCAHALALAGARPGGLWQVREGGMGKSWHNALAAAAGVGAARWAQAGVEGPLSALEGPQGLYRATCERARPERLLADGDAAIFDVSFKPWPACRHAHPAIDAALLVRAAMAQRSPERIAQVAIEAYGDALRFCDRATPTDEMQAKFSLQHAVAVVLGLGRPEALHFRPPFLADRRLVCLRGCTRVAIDTDIEARYPDHYGTRVTVTLIDGERIVASVQDALGDPQNPLSIDDLRDKASTLMTDAGIADRDAELLIDGLLHGPYSMPMRQWYAEVLQWL